MAARAKNVHDAKELMGEMEDNLDDFDTGKKKKKKKNKDLPPEEPIPDDPTAPVEKKTTFCVKVMKFLLSEAGLLLVVLGYILLGGVLFQAIELPAEMDAANSTRYKAMAIDEERRRMYHEILTVTNYALDNDHNRTWTIMDRYQLMVIDAIADGYDGTVHDPDEEVYGWRLASSILFAATILTTIGYGHISPASEVGKLICIIYSTMAVPLMSIFLIKVGGGVTKVIVIMYNKGMCAWCGKRRKVQKQRDETENPEAQKKKKIDPETLEAQKLVEEMGGNAEDLPATEVVDEEEYFKDENEASPPTMLVLFIVVAYLTIGTVVFHLTEDNWSLINSMYCCFITLTTLGFGDYVPGVNGGSGIVGSLLLAFTAFYVMVGLAVLAMGIEIIGDTVAAAAAKAAGEEEEEEKPEETTTGPTTGDPATTYDDDPTDVASVPDIQ